MKFKRIAGNSYFNLRELDKSVPENVPRNTLCSSSGVEFLIRHDPTLVPEQIRGTKFGV